ncbi:MULTISPECIES: hypothetical protein [Acidithiobacillus]|uniref:hypothetical protein n=1 Tax=Acidithiobacillus TaxID=119977 RepID=UPI00094B3F9A|nr:MULTISPECIES: hypothetical protein [Acidithiobacillus]MBE7564148.1 replication protein [Acidithiobacillus sp. HP-6]MBE7569410.1 replication protein [Acidithiobacillus sp. HP-2]
MESKTRPPKKRNMQSIKPVPENAFSNKQLNLFQDFLVNSDSESEALSNAIDLWDSIPRYSISRKKEDELRLPGGFLPARKVDFKYRGRNYIAQIRPARIDIRDKNGNYTGDTIEHYPSAREELIEHTLRKLATESFSGFYDAPDYRSGVSFTLHRLRTELAKHGHSMTYNGIVEGLEILHYSYLAVIDAESDPNDPNMISQPYFPALAKVNRKKRAEDPEAKWFVQFHGLVTNSINHITYRQFNYQRLMKCNSQLARWIISQLVLKYTQASITNSFQINLSTIKRDSVLLDGYSRQRDALAALNEAWEEIKSLGAVSLVEKVEKRGVRGKLEDVVYTIFPTSEFAQEQKAANRRRRNAAESQLSDSPHEI